MVNYGYDKEQCKGKEKEIAESIAKELNLPIGWGSTERDEAHDKPYVEYGDDTLYGGVRIRKITNLTEAEETALITKADAIVKEMTDTK